MNIGFDAKRAFFNSTGLGQYSRTLIKSLAACFPDNQYHLYVPRRSVQIGEALFQPSGSNMKVSIPPTLRDGILGGAFWRSVYMGNAIKRDKVQLFHGLSNELPLNIHRSGAKSIVTVHDLLFVRYPHFYPAFDRWIYTQKLKAACRLADKIITVSRQTKDDLLEYIRVNSDKVDVVYQSCDEAFYSYDDAVFLQHGFFVQKEYHLPYELPEKYILYVGSLTPRKNLLPLVKAFGLMATELSDVHLVIAGEGPEKATIENYIAQQYSLQHKVKFLSHVAQEYLPALMRCAQALVYPSITEGFGIPILEGLFSRIPVVAGDSEAAREAGGQHTLYVQPDDTESFAQTLKDVVSVGALRIDMMVNGWNYAQQFRQENTATRLMEVYKSLV